MWNMLEHTVLVVSLGYNVYLYFTHWTPYSTPEELRQQETPIPYDDLRRHITPVMTTDEVRQAKEDNARRDGEQGWT